jgi:DNA repair ATPase RecN
MKSGALSLVTALVALFSLASTTACKGKVEQCNAFIDRANQAQTAIGAMKFESEEAAQLDSDAAKIETEAKAVEGVKLKDDKLLAFQKSYGKNLTDLAKNVRDLAKLHAALKAGKTDVEAQAKKLEADADKVGKDSDKLIDDINKYCSGGT